MNALIKLVEKYNGTLKRDEKSMKDFLQQYYADYIKDLRNAVNIDMSDDNIEDMKFVGSEMYDMVRNNLDKIEDEANKIVGLYFFLWSRLYTINTKILK